MKLSPPVRTATIVWTLLVAATVASWRIGTLSGLSAAIDEKWESVTVMVIALTKIRCVLLHFMQLKVAPLAWRLIFESWILITGAVTITIYVTAASPIAITARFFS